MFRFININMNIKNTIMTYIVKRREGNADSHTRDPGPLQYSREEL